MEMYQCNRQSFCVGRNKVKFYTLGDTWVPYIMRNGNLSLANGRGSILYPQSLFQPLLNEYNRQAG